MNKRRPRVNSPLVSVFALAVVVPVLLIASWSALGVLRKGFHVEGEIRRAQVLASTLLVLQLEEETAVRGFINTGRRDFLMPYEQSVPEFRSVSDALTEELGDLSMAGGIGAVHEIVALNGHWRSGIAEPIIAQSHPSPNLANALAGREMVGYVRIFIKQIADGLDTREKLVERDAARGFVRATVLAILGTLLLGGGIIAFGLIRSRYENELERERTIAEKLQRAFVHRWDPLPGAAVGTAYLSATREALIGGDLLDVRQLDDERGYVLVADVSGKGIEAAVDTAFVKFTIRALAQHSDDPGAVLEEFNRAAVGQLTSPDTFVVAFLGFFDARRRMLRYASAGHAGAFLRRAHDVQLLRVTGPLLGVSPDETFESASLALEPDDLIVLATDGLTEARNAERSMLGEDGAQRWISEATARDAQAIADDLVRRLRRFVASSRLSDDLALVTIRV